MLSKGRRIGSRGIHPALRRINMMLWRWESWKNKGCSEKDLSRLARAIKAQAKFI
jgi:hypothetical protein